MSNSNAILQNEWNESKTEGFTQSNEKISLFTAQRYKIMNPHLVFIYFKIINIRNIKIRNYLQVNKQMHFSWPCLCLRLFLYWKIFPICIENMCSLKLYNCTVQVSPAARRPLVDVTHVHLTHCASTHYVHRRCRTWPRC